MYVPVPSARLASEIHIMPPCGEAHDFSGKYEIMKRCGGKTYAYLSFESTRMSHRRMDVFGAFMICNQQVVCTVSDIKSCTIPVGPCTERYGKVDHHLVT